MAEMYNIISDGSVHSCYELTEIQKKILNSKSVCRQLLNLIADSDFNSHNLNFSLLSSIL